MGCATSATPNFIFILVDDLGWADLGCYGSSFYETPHLDKLAASGLRFTNAYAACPVCSPTRAAIMTGQHPVRLGITDWIPGQDPQDRKLLGPADKHELALAETTIAEVLQEHGYSTFFAGKWHLGGEGYLPVQQGFAINKGGHHRGSPPGGYYSPYKNPKLADGPAGEYLTDRLTDESIQFLKKNVTNPFLLFLSFYTVHTPIQACARHLQKFQDKAAALSVPEYAERLEHNGYTKLLQNDPEYATMVYAMDENVGRLLRALEDLGLDQNTIIFFTSDNGGLSTLGRHWAPTSNEPLRAGKGWCYEGGIRVPLIIRAPGLTRAGSIHDEPVMSMDFFPTMLDLAALPHMPEKHIDGLSLLPLLRGGERLDREALYWHYPHYHGSTWTPGAAIRVREWKLIEFYHYETVELYNLMEDVQESNDLADKLPDVRDQLLQHLHAWQARLGASMPKLNPAFVE
ncbi:sulfatase [candidate division KSB1 bacterium]|nr:sulfatase [candidate division KSB1 bacterium]